MSRKQRWLRGALIAGASAVMISVTLRSVHTQPTSQQGLPMRVRGLVCAQAFKLEHGYAHAWRAEQPWVTCGWLLVLAIDPVVAAPRDELEPVMFVGDEVAERVNPGDLAGRRLVIVPSQPDANGWPALDPLSQPMWLGDRALPEQLDLAAVHAARIRAEAHGIAAFAHSEVAAAFDCGNGRELLADRDALQRHAANLILVHAPQESAFASGLLAPPVD